MIDDKRPGDKKRCKAMIDAGIADPTSQEGIDFCVNRCPYAWCTVVDGKKITRHVSYRTTVTHAKDLRSRGVTVKDIGIILRLSQRTVLRYLKK